MAHKRFEKLRLFLIVAALAVCVLAQSSLAEQNTPLQDDRNWVALHVYDSFYPMTQQQSFPEILNSLEIIHQLWTFRKFKQDMTPGFVMTGPDYYGSRSREGHYMLWIHLSERFQKNSPVNRQVLGEQLFMYPNRESDLFTGWSGDVNLAALFRQGLRGLAAPIPSDEPEKPYAGRFQSFKEAVAQGEADYEAGWYMTDEQTEKILTTFKSYPGTRLGYSFMRLAEARPDVAYEPPEAQLVNGYNCGDFAFYALTTAGIISREVAESLKVQFRYPKYYFDHPIPLKGVGLSGFQWLQENLAATKIPESALKRIAWYDLMFSDNGLEFFDLAKLGDAICTAHHEMTYARIWDQEHTIQWLKSCKATQFRSKGIVTELLSAVESGQPILSPERTIPETPENRYRLSTEFQELQKEGRALQDKKNSEACITGF